MTGPIVVMAWYLASHAQSTPSGGFQGGVVLATAFVLIYLAGQFLTLQAVQPRGRHRRRRGGGGGRLRRHRASAAVAMGLAYLTNFLPLAPPPAR